MIYKEITQHEFAHIMSDNDDNGFSYDGASMLFDYIEGFGENMEFDMVGVRCEYSEFSVSEFISEYKGEYNEFLKDNEYTTDYEEAEEEFMDHCEDNMEGFITFDSFKDVILITIM